MLTYRIIEPLYVFRDAGKEPMFTTYAQAIELLGPDKDLSDLAIRYEMHRSNVTEEEVVGQGRFMVSVIRDSLHKGETQPINMIGGFADRTDGNKLLAFTQTNKVAVNQAFTTALARAIILAEMNAADMGMAGVKSVIAPDDVVAALAYTQRRLPVDIKFGGQGGLAGTPSGQALMDQWNEKLKHM